MMQHEHGRTRQPRDLDERVECRRHFGVRGNDDGTRPARRGRAADGYARARVASCPDLPETILQLDAATQELTLGGTREEHDVGAVADQIAAYLSGCAEPVRED